MNTKQKRRLIAVAAIIIIVSIASALILYALKQNINLFYTPTELAKADVNPEQHVRIGGYVKKKSVHYDASGKSVNFIVTDYAHDVRVNFDGVLPNLFREGQVVVVTGKLNPQHIFLANEVLAKHDEKYMPKQLAKDLKAPPVESEK
jgi:cytochrome c-type biogenesis protein CcmE